MEMPPPPCQTPCETRSTDEPDHRPVRRHDERAEEVAQLGSSLTCAGAEKAGNKDGVAAYTGKWLGAPAGISGTAEPTQDPYADEKPLYTISAQNAAQYAPFLSPGQLAMFKKYASYKMPVYPSHRDFRYPDWVCERTKENAKNG